MGTWAVVVCILAHFCAGAREVAAPAEPALRRPHPPLPPPRITHDAFPVQTKVFDTTRGIYAGPVLAKAFETTHGIYATPVLAKAFETTHGIYATPVLAKAFETTHGIYATPVLAKAFETTHGIYATPVLAKAFETTHGIYATPVLAKAFDTTQGIYATTVFAQAFDTNPGISALPVRAKAFDTTHGIYAAPVPESAFEPSPGISVTVVQAPSSATRGCDADQAHVAAAPFGSPYDTPDALRPDGVIDHHLPYLHYCSRPRWCGIVVAACCISTCPVQHVHPMSSSPRKRGKFRSTPTKRTAGQVAQAQAPQAQARQPDPPATLAQRQEVLKYGHALDGSVGVARPWGVDIAYKDVSKAMTFLSPPIRRRQ